MGVDCFVILLILRCLSITSAFFSKINILESYKENYKWVSPFIFQF